MKRSNLLWCMVLLLAAIFAVKTGFDYSGYTTTLNSAPFWVWVMMNGVYFLLPAAVLAAAAVILGKKEQ